MVKAQEMKFLAALLVVTLLTASCGDDIQPPTWHDAWERWSIAYCAYYERCDGDYFSILFDDFEDCVYRTTAHYCADSLYSCLTRWPESRENALSQCEMDMEAQACDAEYAPDSCYKAFEY